MADTFQFEIVTPDRQVVKDVAEEMEIPGRDGYLGILPGHAPLITELGVGEISYRNANVTHRFAVAWGFAEVLPDKVTILAETAERPTEIDIARAQKAKAQAEQILKTPDANTDYPRTLEALARATNRIEVAGKPE